jgi:hypothetical protein
MKKTLCIGLLVFAFATLAIAANGLVFKNMITKPVLEEAVSKIARDIKMGDRSNTKANGILNTATYWTRQALFNKKVASFNIRYASLAVSDYDNNSQSDTYWIQKKGAKQSIVDKYKAVKKCARVALNNPTILKTTYFLWKNCTLDLLKKYGIAKEAKAELMTVLPYFNRGLNSEELANNALTKSAHVNNHEWVKRRGNIKLVNAYAEIIKDMIKSL